MTEIHSPDAVSSPAASMGTEQDRDDQVGTDRVERHLKRLLSALPLLADISMADVLIWQRLENDTGFVAIGHRRPMNARTVYPDQKIGTTVTDIDRPLLADSWHRGAESDGGIFLVEQDRWIRSLAVPVRFEGRVVAMLTREFSPTVEDIPGDLQLTMFSVLRRLAQMVSDGTYPYAGTSRPHDHPPRVGDGLMVLDARGVVEFASPNATTSLRSVGIIEEATGRALTDLGLDASKIAEAYDHGVAVFDTYETDDGVVSYACYPLVEFGEVTGALVLLRDIAELRDRDRLLLTKDATIAEIHHRVKNNLQTIASLLQLQARRIESPEARSAIAETERRIRAIGVVHEMLSHRSADEIPFGQVIEKLTQMVGEAMTGPDRPIEIVVSADEVVLPARMTTSLAIAISELLQNCLDHAFVAREGDDDGLTQRPHLINIFVIADDDGLVATVADNGVGLPEGFSLERTGLGLTIVQTMIESELRGELRYDASVEGTSFAVEIPFTSGPEDE